MTNPDPKKIEDWSEFQRRVIAAEKYHGRGFLPSVKAGSVIAIIAGVLLMLLYTYVVRRVFIYNIGVFLVFASVIVLVVIYWVNSGSSVLKKERERMIQDRGVRKRCIYLEGTLPDGLSPVAGSCKLYNKALVSYPYCIYCKTYTTKKHEEEKKLNVQIN